MVWLEAAIAFAVVMMVSSTLVTAILELLHRILNLRESGLRRIVEIVYGTHIRTRLAEVMDAQGGAASDFIERMTRARFQPVDPQARRVSKVAPTLLNATRMTHLTTLEFIERLAETDEGRLLYVRSRQLGQAYLTDFLHDLASKYEDIGQSASEYFTRRARASSMLVSIALAAAVNLNAITLFDALVSDKDLRDAWIQRGEEVAQTLKQKQAELAQLRQRSAPPADGQSQVDEIEANLRQIQALIEKEKSLGVPLGWELAPWNLGGWTDKDAADKVWRSLKWLLGVLLAGLLVGLGGPFWFDAYRKLTAATGLARGLLTPVQKPKEPGQPPAAAAADLTSDLVRVFETAARASAMEASGGRALLTPEGHVDKGN